MERIWIAVVLAGCAHHRYDHDKPPTPVRAPVPLVEINSPFDDFNSATPIRAQNQFVFSTNRGSQGHDFDFYGAFIRWQSGGDEIHAVSAPVLYAPGLRTDANERGPIFLRADWIGSRERFAFASDRPGGMGGLDLYATECLDKDDYERTLAACDTPATLHPLTGLNSSADDAYLTRPVEDHVLLFSSNREGPEHHIYVAAWNDKDSIDATPASIKRVNGLNSDADDDAPFVYGLGPNEANKEVVFASSRAGSLGEHDLYCARYEHDQSSAYWTTPMHLSQYSSPRDEYRPIIINVLGQRFLVFSSTRDGGQGGYDLYIVGYDGCR